MKNRYGVKRTRVDGVWIIYDKLSGLTIGTSTVRSKAIEQARTMSDLDRRDSEVAAA